MRQSNPLSAARLGTKRQCRGDYQGGALDCTVELVGGREYLGDCGVEVLVGELAADASAKRYPQFFISRKVPIFK
ncbi:hypothetical protein B5P44_25795 [Mycobacterium sp. CBMA 213]|nr:hypothetical protein [Mycolicibacterium sp. CBMA 213]